MTARNRFLKDLAWKFFSLALAVAIWLTVNYKDESASAPHRQTTYNDLPVMAVSLPAGEHAQISPVVVAVTVSGPSDALAVLQANEIRAIVNLNALAAGNDLQRSVEVAVPPGVTVVSVDPAEVAVTVSSPGQENKEELP